MTVEPSTGKGNTRPYASADASTNPARASFSARIHLRSFTIICLASESDLSSGSPQRILEHCARIARARDPSVQGERVAAPDDILPAAKVREHLRAARVSRRQ